jgi:CO/xanthine dehydrogenase FAD-binding subunit
VELDFGDDQRASAEYRRMICPVLVERALKEVLS